MAEGIPPAQLGGMDFDRERRVGRVRLLQPVPAVADGERAYVVDASLRGVRLSHTNLFLQETQCGVTFEWNGKPIELVGKIRWTKAQRIPSNKNIYYSGFEIEAVRTDAASALRSLVEECVERALDEQKANVNGIPPVAASLMQGATSILYGRHELIDGVWRKIMTSDARQPLSGFTVSASESRHQVELLKKTYEAADPALRETIRKLAEISVSETVPARRYIP